MLSYMPSITSTEIKGRLRLSSARADSSTVPACYKTCLSLDRVARPTTLVQRVQLSVSISPVCN